MAGLTLDAGALLAIERGDRRVTILVHRALERGDPVEVPATALAQVLRDPATQVPLMRFLRRPRTPTVPLDRASASQVGQLLARTSTTDIADAQVVVCAQRSGRAVLTSDPGDLRRLDPALVLLPC